MKHISQPTQKLDKAWFLPTSKCRTWAATAWWKLMYSVLFSKAHIQAYTEFLWRLVFHWHGYGGLCTAMAFTPAIYKKCNIFYHCITPTA